MASKKFYSEITIIGKDLFIDQESAMYVIKQWIHSHFTNINASPPLPDAEQELNKAQFFESMAINDHLQDIQCSVSSNDRNAVWYVLRAALRGNTDASFKLGLYYLHGEHGLDQDYKKAEKWLEQAAHQGHPEAVHYLHEAYH